MLSRRFLKVEVTDCEYGGFGSVAGMMENCSPTHLPSEPCGVVASRSLRNAIRGLVILILTNLNNATLGICGRCCRAAVVYDR